MNADLNGMYVESKSNKVVTHIKEGDGRIIQGSNLHGMNAESKSHYKVLTHNNGDEKILNELGGGEMHQGKGTYQVSSKVQKVVTTQNGATHQQNELGSNHHGLQINTHGHDYYEEEGVNSSHKIKGGYHGGASK